MIDLIATIRYLQTELPNFEITLGFSKTNRTYIQAVDENSRTYLIYTGDFPITAEHSETEFMNWAIKTLNMRKEEGIHDQL